MYRLVATVLVTFISKLFPVKQKHEVKSTSKYQIF